MRETNEEESGLDQRGHYVVKFRRINWWELFNSFSRKMEPYRKN